MAENPFAQYQIRDSAEILDDLRRKQDDGSGFLRSLVGALGFGAPNAGGMPGAGNNDPYSAVLQGLIAKRAGRKASYEDRQTIAEMTGVVPEESIGPYYSNGMRNPRWGAQPQARPANAFSQYLAPYAPQSAGQPVGRNSLMPGMIAPGNIDLTKRPTVKNGSGYSTVLSMSRNFDGREVLFPRVGDDGRILSPDEAMDQFLRTGKHLGVFETPEAADAYAQQLHEDQARMYGDQGATQ